MERMRVATVTLIAFLAILSGCGPWAAPAVQPARTPQERADQIRAAVSSFYDGLRQDMRASGAGDLGFSADDYLAMVRRSARLDLVEQKIKEHLARDLPDDDTLAERAQEMYDSWKADLVSQATIVRQP